MTDTNEKPNYISLRDIQFFGNLDPEKKSEIYALKQKIQSDGRILFSESDLDILREYSSEKKRGWKSIRSLLDTIENSEQKYPPYEDFVPDEYYKLQNKFHKFTTVRNFSKWVSGLKSEKKFDESSQFHSNKLDSILPELRTFLKILNINKKVNFYKFKKSSVLNYNFQHASTIDEIKIYIPEEIEESLTESELMIISQVTIIRSLLDFLYNHYDYEVDEKLESYYEKEPEVFRDELKKVFGNKWEKFLFTFYSLCQIRELVIDKLALFIFGDKQKLLSIYSKIQEVKEHSFDTDGEIFLIEDIWGEESFSHDVSSILPDLVVRFRFIQFSENYSFNGKQLKKYKFWSNGAKKALKELYTFKD